MIIIIFKGHQEEEQAKQPEQLQQQEQQQPQQQQQPMQSGMIFQQLSSESPAQLLDMDRTMERVVALLESDQLLQQEQQHEQQRQQQLLQLFHQRRPRTAGELLELLEEFRRCQEKTGEAS